MQMFIFKALEQFGWLSLTVFFSPLEFVIADIRVLISLPGRQTGQHSNLSRSQLEEASLGKGT